MRLEPAGVSDRSIAGQIVHKRNSGPPHFHNPDLRVYNSLRSAASQLQETGYGLVAALSLLKGKNMLPSVEHETQLIEQLVDSGLVDGTTGDSTYYVDGFTTDENGVLLRRLHALVDKGLGTL